MAVDPDVPGNVNITNCDREPIHIIPQSQAHGVILVCNKLDFTITQCSGNIEETLNFKLQDVLSKPLSFILRSEKIETLHKNVLAKKPLLPEELHLNGSRYFMIPHMSGAHLVLDIEPFGNSIDPVVFQDQLVKINNEIDETQTIEEMCQQAVSLVNYLYEYDRVMMYRFDEDWNGEVVAEVREQELESWLGLHYPATDIPKPAREIFLKQGVRIIADVKHKASEIHPAISPITNQPLDISKSELRGVSPIHIEYLRNMEVGASLTAAIVLNGKLWGLLACHHYSPKFINYHQRQSCKFLTQVFSNKLALKTSNIFLNEIAKSEEVRKELLSFMNSGSDIIEAITANNSRFTDIINCGGGAVYSNGKLRLVGSTPAEEEIILLILNFLGEKKERFFQTKHLSKHYTPAEEFKETASGLLSVRIGEVKEEFIMWFRPQSSSTVNWGGNPQKNGIVKDGIEYLSPRKSFERWAQEVSGVAVNWEKYDFEAAIALQDTITHVLVKRQKVKIEELNHNLSEANKELKTFSYSVSHDLRGPLRGIEGFAQILSEDYAPKLDDFGQNAVNVILKSVERMDVLIEDILSYSKVGQARLVKNKFSLKELVDEIILSKNREIHFPNAEISVDRNLPNIEADKRMISQLMNNLIDNAIKYSSGKEKPLLEIGSFKNNLETVFFVKDNGIGFDQKHGDKVFEVFTRLAGDKYQGSGVGLAIAKKVVEKHKGEIWVETALGEGTTFFFTLKEE
ncbi:ATP-binding protein [Salegentibacter sp. F188]|uniref:histidine kinase n=1 Tax=Autumnicola patrickiae TaxID=3075591 RepID=A0ABU3E1T5_9FLAO|nr:ATP-binding protein [Salegentibacter sp. F188]MDT0689863.1 ATP-binding protein [Salegentibacter sp. F188]